MKKINQPANQFQEYQISKEILEALTILGYTSPTKIQKEVLPLALQRKNIVAKSQTGSGKTAAFAILLCEQAVWEDNTPTALVLEPTRELTVQVKQEIAHIGKNKRLKVPAVFGGFPIDKQILTLKQKTHIVVGTPGRVADHLRRESLVLSNIKTVVIDEADLMLDMGFIDEVRQILSAIPKPYEIMLFSATLGKELENLVVEYVQEPVYVQVEEIKETKAQITQKIYPVASEQKYETFLKLLVRENPDSCMIFCGTREMVNVLCRKLRKDGVKCGMIHGDLDQQDRILTVERFRQGQFLYLIATDVVARGIDFEDLSHVFNYDFPTGKECYVHRIGRTGRNGKPGIAISLMTPEEEKMKRTVEDYIEEKLPLLEIEEADVAGQKSFWDRQKEKPKLKPQKGAGFSKSIMNISIGGGKKSKMRAVDIVGSICSVEGIEAGDIGIIDIRDSLTYVEILNGKGETVLTALQEKNIKGKIRKVRKTRIH